MFSFTRSDPSATCNPLQLAAQISTSIGKPVTCDIDGASVVIYEDITGHETAIQAIIDAYVYEDGWAPPGPEADWRTKLQAEIQFIADALANPSTNWTSAAAVKRLARNQLRILKFMRNRTFDTEV